MTLTERISAAIERHPEKDDRYISKGIRGATLAAVRAVRAGEPIPEPVPMTPHPIGAETKTQIGPGVTLIPVEDIKRKYDLFQAILDVIGSLPPGAVITEPDLRASIDQPDQFRFRKTLEAHDRELEPYRIMIKYKGSEARYHYARPEVISDIRRTLEKP